MLSRNILRNLVSRALASTGRRSARRLIRGNSATERLESRKLLTTFTVTNSNDSNSASGTLRAAISQANFNPGPDTIDFDTAVNGVEIDLAFGQMDITGSLEIIGNGAENTIIDARQFSRIFNIMDSSLPFAGSPPFGGSSVSSVIPTDVTISNVTLKNGKVAFNSAAGGAIQSQSGTLSISGSTFTGNSVVGTGANIFGSGGGAILAGGPITIVNSNFSGNTTTGDDHHGGAIWAGVSVIVTRSTFSGNSTATPYSNGGAIYAYQNANVTLNQSTFSGNSTAGENANGGAVFVDTNGSVNVNQSTLSGNSTTGNDAEGGAIFAAQNAEVRVIQSTLAGNSTTGFNSDGGAIYAAPDANVTISRSTLSGNSTAGETAGGGAIYGFQNNSITLSQSTVSGNSTAGPSSTGGGIYAYSGSVMISQSTVTLNAATQSSGGGIFNSNAPLTIQNSIVAGNTDNGTASDVRKPNSAPFTVQSSLIGRNNGTDLTATGLTPGTNGNLIGGDTDALKIDPLLGPLRNNGGPTQTHFIPFFPVQSPALDKGSNALAVDVTQLGTPALTTDQRGNPFVRIDSPFSVDMGAYENQTLAPAFFVVTTTTDELDYSNSAVSLREAISSANGSVGANIITFATATNFSEFDLTLGEILITETLTITGNTGSQNRALTTIDAQQLSRIFHVQHGDFTLNSVVLKNGKTTENEILTGGGRVGGAGGAIKSSSTNSTLTINQSLLSGNTTTGIRASGGAIFSYYGNIIVSDSTLTENSTAGQQATGGAIHARLGSVTVSDSKLTSNGTTFAISDGGALYARAGAVNITRSTLSGNSTTGGAADGGAIFARFGTMTILQSTLSGNTISGVESAGGAIAAPYGNLTIIQSTISGNQGTGTTGAEGPNFKSRGGGIWVNNSAVTIINSTITNNSASGIGGGLFVSTDSSDKKLTIHNSIIAGNTALVTPDFTAPTNPATNLEVRHSLIGDSTGNMLTETPSVQDSNGNWIGGVVTGIIDPELAPLADNGGPTLTHALQVNSLAINFGLNSLAVDVSQAGSSALTTDQRGGTFKRVLDLKVDMGAFESASGATGPIVVSTSLDELDGDIGDGNLSLREAIALANERAGANEITFAASTNGTDLLLSLGQMSITETVTITGNGADKSIIDADQASRFFTVSSGDLTLNGLTFKNGRTTQSGEKGGAIYFESSGILTINRSALSNNSTTGVGADGGAVFLNNSAGLVANQSTISGNSTANGSADGGAIYGFGGNSITLSQSTVSGNSTTGAFSKAGAIYLNSGNLTISQSTLTLNNAALSPGGAVFSANATIVIRNSIVAGNTDNGTASDVRKAPSQALTVTASLIGRNTGSGLTATAGTTPDANGNLIGGNTSALRIDPQLAALANNGGPTQTHSLLTASPAINRGRNNLAVDVTQAGNPALTSDQRGLPFSRIFNTTVDMGALELITFASAIVVSTAADELDGNLSTGDVSLREAILLANGLPGTNTIAFATTTNGLPINLLLGQIEITESVTITGNGTANTFVDGQLTSRLFVITGQAVALNGMTLRNGKTTADGDNGGAIRLDSSGLLTISNSVLTGNSTTGEGADGGAIFTNSGSLTINQSTLSGNSTAGRGADGGVLNAVSGTVTITQSTVSGNSTAGTDAVGGAIAAFTGPLSISQSTLSGNSSKGDRAHGGAIYAITGAVSISQSTLAGNFTTNLGAEGGAVFAGTGALNIVQSTLTGNHTGGANAKGGAIAFISSALNIKQSTLSGNFATGSNAHGGALFGVNGPVTLVQTTMSGNSTGGAGAGGGGLFVDDSIVRIINSTITANTATGVGGGVGILTNPGDKKLTIHNSIIAGNTAATNPDFTSPTTPGTNLEVRNSLIGRNNGTTLAATVGTTPGTNGNLVGGNSDLLKINPQLGVLANNGGSTETHALLANSPAFNRGSNALAIDPSLAGSPALTTDQRGTGFGRTVFGNVDIGAVEKTTLDGTAGDDAYVLTYSSVSTSGIVTISVSTNGGPVVSLGTSPMSSSLAIDGLGGTDSVRVVGTSAADSFTVNSGTSVTVNGASLILTSIENRTLAGAAGSDIYRFDADSALSLWALEESGVGTDTIDFAPTTAAVSIFLGTAVTQVINSNLSLKLNSTTAFENATGGSGDDTLVGSTGANVLSGNGGKDVFYPGLGSDSLIGGPGDDTYNFSTPTAGLEADTVTELASGGTDTVNFTSITTDVIVNLTLTTVQTVHANRTLKLNLGTTLENATGGSGNDTLGGNTLANTLIGNGGNDAFYGGLGSDVLVGGLGNDTYHFSPATGTSEADSVTEAANAGTDTLNFSGITTSVVVNLTLATTQAVHTNRTLKLNSGSTLENANGGSGNDALGGNSLVNVLAGNGGNDAFYPGLGSDTLIGGPGDDTYHFSTATAGLEAETVTELAGGGTDTLNFAGISTNVIANLALTTVQNVHANRTLILNLNNSFESVLGGSANDTLTGNTLDNVLVGNAGADTLVGGDGRDILIGGLGLDTLNGGAGDDILIAGRTTSDSSVANLNTLRTQWISGNSYAARITNLRAGVGSPVVSLKAKTNVLNDAGEIDALTGGADTDWYFRALDDAITDLFAGELTDVL